MNCRTCEYPSRFAHGVQGNPVRSLPPVSGNAWGETLTRCPECAQLWFTIPYEPWGGYPHSVAWRWSEEQWSEFNDPPQGGRHNLIYFWHEAELFRFYDGLDEAGQQRIKDQEGFLQGSIHREDASHALEQELKNQANKPQHPTA